jgi:hypothetical protein
MNYLLPKKIMQKCKIDIQPIKEFGGKKLQRIGTPDGRTFLIDNSYGLNGTKLSSVVYEYNKLMPVKMTCLYDKYDNLDKILFHNGLDDRNRKITDILDLKPNTWTKFGKDETPGYGAVEDYLGTLN